MIVPNLVRFGKALLGVKPGEFLRRNSTPMNRSDLRRLKSGPTYAFGALLVMLGG